MKLIPVLIFILFSFFQTAYPCSLIIDEIGKFDRTEFVFIGEVVGYTKPVKFKKAKKDAFGLVVKIKEKVYLPRTLIQHFELFPLGLRADCSLSGAKLRHLKFDFPVGSEIRVIAKQAKILPKSTSDKRIRLEDRPGELGGIALNRYSHGRKMSSPSSIFDYKSHSFDSNKDSDSKYLLPAFEIRKDLLRLSKTKKQKERNKILDRLLFAPGSSFLDHSLLFDNYTSSKAESRRYFEKQLKLSNPEFYKNEYLPVKYVLNELSRLSYSKKIAEDALGKALERGGKIGRDSLLKLCLEILKKKKNNNFQCKMTLK